VFPNPQDAIPLPPSPSLVQYRKLAKDLVKACAQDPPAIGAWADQWMGSLAKALGEPQGSRGRELMNRAADNVDQFATRHLKGGANCQVSGAQFVIARSHGFMGWPKLVEHLDQLAHAETAVAGYEAAADAIVAGDEDTLRRLLAEHPGLTRARSTREHNSTLLHYVSANGVEGYRQITPPNIVNIARMLLVAGAEVDAEADVYGGGSTTLGLVATSAHPRHAGNQNELIQVLLDHGARLEQGIAGNKHGAVMGCLANGCPEAARYLADHGAVLGLVDAAGVGRLDVVKTFVDASGEPRPPITRDDLREALGYAACYGSYDVARFLVLDCRVNPAGHSGDGMNALHYAVIGGNLDILKLLLAQPDPPIEQRNEYGGTVLGQAMWSSAHHGPTDDYIPILETLLAAGAKPPERHPPINERIDALLAKHGCIADSERYWFGEEPRSRRV